MRLPPTSILVTMDINGLYINIGTEMGLWRVKATLDSYPDRSRPDILELLHLSLTRTDFEFDGKFYLQVKGVAMGKKFAPAYADIYMATWESSVFPKCAKTPAHYLLYLYDIWGVWTHPKQDFHVFVGTSCQFSPPSRFGAFSNPN